MRLVLFGLSLLLGSGWGLAHAESAISSGGPVESVSPVVLAAVASETPIAAGQYPMIKTAPGWSRALQAGSGFTLLSGWMANRLLHHALVSHVAGGSLHTRLLLFSGSDLWSGKARGIELSGQHVLLEKWLPLSEVSVQSVSESPLFVSRGKRPLLLNPVRLKVHATLHEQDLNRFLTSSQGKVRLTGIQLLLPPFGLQTVDCLQPQVQLKQDEIVLKSVLNQSGANSQENAVPVQLSGNLVAKHSKLGLANVNLQVEGVEETQPFAQLIETYFGNLVNLNRIKIARHKVRVTIEKSEVRPGKINLEALVTVEPDPKALKKIWPKPVAAASR